VCKSNTGASSCNHFRRRKTISVTYSEGGFVSWLIVHALCMRHIIWSSVACLVVPYFPYYLIKVRFSGKSCRYNNPCVEYD
jgi:hypothetical protein